MQLTQHVKATIKAILVLGGAAAAAYYFASHQTSRLPPAQSTIAAQPGCLEFFEGIPVLCSADRTPLYAGVVNRICLREGPHRWTVTSTDSDTRTILGGTCYSVYRGEY